MTWREIAEIHGLGFEIGNHAWTHGDFSTPRGASHLAGELALTENELQKVGVPRPVSFAYCGNNFGPEAFRVLRDAGYRFSRRGLPPEAEYGKLQVGATFDPYKHHPLLIPSTGDAYPNWTFEHFERVLAEAREGQAVILQFHGVPDRALQPLVQSIDHRVEAIDLVAQLLAGHSVLGGCGHLDLSFVV